MFLFYLCAFENVFVCLTLCSICLCFLEIILLVFENNFICLSFCFICLFLKIILFDFGNDFVCVFGSDFICLMLFPHFRTFSS